MCKSISRSRTRQPLAEAFNEELARRSGRSIAEEDAGALQARLEEVLASAQTAWPGIELEGTKLARALGRHVRADRSPADLDNFALKDLYLATACVAGDAVAISSLSTRILPILKSKLIRRNFRPDVVDDVLSNMRERLLYATEAQPATLSLYAGRGSLEGWLMRTACRDAARYVARERRESEPLLDIRAATWAAASEDPETLLFRRKYAAEFRTAMTTALERLGPSERRLLHQALVEGQSSVELAEHRQVHRVTINRWLSEIRSEVLANVYADIGTRLRLSKTEVQRLAHMIGPDLEVSVARILQNDKDQ